MSFMDKVRPGKKRAIAAEVWQMMRDLTFAATQRGGHIGMLKELGLTPGHLKVLGALQPDEPRPMGALADACACDASMATWLVDRLEDRGLVERRMLPADRRVKTVALTALGIQTKERLFEHLDQPPPELLGLDTASLQALRRELAKLPTGGSAWRSATAPAAETRAAARRPTG
jgi:DNA-binding MarR family transcriptional regulator